MSCRALAKTFVRLQDAERVGLGKLEKLVTKLPGKARGPDHVEALRSAAGKKINADERAFLLDHYQKESKRYTKDARVLLAELAGASPGDPSAPVLALKSRHFTKIAEQSALTFVPALGGFFAVDDETSNLHFIKRSAIGKGGGVPSASFAIAGLDLDDLEGLTFDTDRSRLLLITEGKRAVYEVPLEIEGSKFELGTAKKLATLPKLGADENAGYEGIAYLPASLSPDHKAHVLVVHEFSPKQLTLLNPDTLKPEAAAKLGPELDHLLKDVSDIAVNPKTGHLALLSDESSRVAFVKLELGAAKKGKPHQIQGSSKSPASLSLLGTLELPALDEDHAKKKAKRLQAEGITFDAQASLWVSAEGDRSFMRFAP